MAQQQNLVKLASQDRAYSATRPWSAEELTALLTLERVGNMARAKAAMYVRNGITTIEAYRAAEKAKFVPKTLEQIQEDAVKAHLAGVQEQLKADADAEEAKAKAEEAKKGASKNK